MPANGHRDERRGGFGDRDRGERGFDRDRGDRGERRRDRDGPRGQRDETESAASEAEQER